MDELKLIVENRNTSKVINLRSYTILYYLMNMIKE
jgi:hypothetical protein